VHLIRPLIRNIYKYLRSVPLILWIARDSRTKYCARFLKSVRVGGANKTQIVYSCNSNFRSVVLYLDLLISNGLMERAEGSIVRYRTTAKGEVALGHMRELEKMMPEGKVK